ncbi:type I restriction enzyme HsdR N-terminal domain-containing protein [Flavobacterium sp. MAH-1]|uniref:Type I restriction enzyme HsdR N-terminal domain-containing protein n=1 Tax=Flavobacterium agri TaxID=2743471 RepID=A0A7Y8Y5K3_9FLAO|nr:type I restriction enzyme HsdR N-terminal domain-containing protein [Flavobacterium agri]NUY82304.1 type I restriction enzyme HsdR N-terminal domain-containing protein [Flavobacterium agri]NYA72328.1 type I restriction enzyme HsdR N-terminal domain-containing protein [Flavobacterium agri]
MLALNFNPYSFRFRNTDGRVSIFCETRRKFVVLTPEEWVRQHVVQFLLQDKKYPKSLINVEKLLKVNGLSKRYDAVVFNPDGSIFLLVECKAPEVTINQQTFDQIARYNIEMNARYLMVTNGLSHYFCSMDYEKKRYIFLKEIPVQQP